MSLPMLRPHCRDVSNKGLIKTIKAASILLQVELNTAGNLKSSVCKQIM